MMSVDLNTGLIAIICTLLVVQHLRRSDEAERVRTTIIDVVRAERDRCKTANAYAFQLYRDALQHAFKDAKHEAEDHHP